MIRNCRSVRQQCEKEEIRDWTRKEKLAGTVTRVFAVKTAAHKSQVVAALSVQQNIDRADVT